MKSRITWCLITLGIIAFVLWQVGRKPAPSLPPFHVEPAITLGPNASMPDFATRPEPHMLANQDMMRLALSSVDSEGNIYVLDRAKRLHTKDNRGNSKWYHCPWLGFALGMGHGDSHSLWFSDDQTRLVKTTRSGTPLW
ncbi:MAG TPA: hypothetical protein VF719_04665 [Abditibacteriaceae bacterium]|jgi:hypothetical protein